MWRLLSNAHDLGPNASCQIPTISPKALDLWKFPPLNIFIFVISLCAGRKKRVIWITIPGWTTQNRVPPASSPSLTACFTRECGAIHWGAQAGGRDFFFLLPIFILTLWKTRRPSSSTAMLSPWHFPLWRLNEDGPPRWSVLASPAHGYSRGCAHLCSPDGDRAPAAGWLSSNKRTQPQTNSSGSSRARGVWFIRLRPLVYAGWTVPGDVSAAEAVSPGKLL